MFYLPCNNLLYCHVTRVIIFVNVKSYQLYWPNVETLRLACAFHAGWERKALNQRLKNKTNTHTKQPRRSCKALLWRSESIHKGPLHREPEKASLFCRLIESFESIKVRGDGTGIPTCTWATIQQIHLSSPLPTPAIFTQKPANVPHLNKWCTHRIQMRWIYETGTEGSCPERLVLRMAKRMPYIRSRGSSPSLIWGLTLLTKWQKRTVTTWNVLDMR